MPKLTDLLTRGAAAKVTGKMRSVNPVAAKNAATRSQADVRQVITLTTSYVKQELKAPLSGLVGFLARGIVSAVLLGTGALLLSLGVLRLLQTETGTVFTHLWSRPLPHLVALLTAVALIGLLYVFWNARTRRKETPQ